MQDAIRVLAGDCTVRVEDRGDASDYRGAVVVLVKPDDTVLVHDADGYQPVAWLTRADAVRIARDAGGFRLVAGAGDRRLRIDCHETFAHAHHPISPAGPPVGTCPDCEGTLVRDGDRIVCIGCLAAHGIPRDAAVLDDDCADCGLPRVRVERGARVEACADRACEPVVEAVRARFGDAWPCPDCGEPLAIRRERGLRASCADCGRLHPIPRGTVAGTCACGLPAFETADGRACLDPCCDRNRWGPREEGGSAGPP